MYQAFSRHCDEQSKHEGYFKRGTQYSELEGFPEGTRRGLAFSDIHVILGPP